MTEPALTDGARRLSALLESDLSPLTSRRVGRALRVSRQSVWNWAKGLGRPSQVKRSGLERITGIPVSAWLTEEERREVAEIEARARGSL